MVLCLALWHQVEDHDHTNVSEVYVSGDGIPHQDTLFP